MPQELNDVLEQAYWEFKARTDPTQQAWRNAHGRAGLGPQSERDAFKAVVLGVIDQQMREVLVCR